MLDSTPSIRNGQYSRDAIILTLTDLIKPFNEDREDSEDSIVFTVNGVDPVASLTRSELNLQARAIGRHLLRNATRGARALLSFSTGPEFFASFFGSLFAGVVAVPVPSARNAQDLAHLEGIGRECGASLFLTTAAIAERVRVVDADFWHRTAMQPFIVDGSAEALDWTPTTEQPSILSNPDEPAYLQFTSGSTGTPRGVMISHANVLANLAMIDVKVGRPRASAAVYWLPLYHDMGLVSSLYTLYAGLRLVLLSPMHFLQQPWRWLKAISHYRAVCSGAPNFGYELCNRTNPPADEPPLDLGCWQFAFCGSEMVRPATLRRFAERFGPFGFPSNALSPAYGLAECTMVVSSVPRDFEANVRKVESAIVCGEPIVPATSESTQPRTEISECGTPGLGHSVRVVDPDSGQVLPDGHVGEFWVTGPSKALGYWQRPEESRTTFHARLEGDDATYLRTGDLGFMEAGRLYVTGRIKELIIVRGRNYHPHTIEEAVQNAHPALGSISAAFSVTTDVEEALIVISEPRVLGWPQIALNDVPLAVQAELIRRLDVKADFIGLVKPGSIPRTTSGKVQRLKCREQYRSGLLELVAVWPPSEPEAAVRQSNTADSLFSAPAPMRFVIENWIKQWLSFRLRIQVQDIDRRQPLSAYGLDSVGAVQLSQAIEDWLEVPVPETLSWSYPTLEELSGYLDQALRKPSSETTATANAPAFQSQVDLALQWAERLSDSEVEHLYRLRLVKE